MQQAGNLQGPLVVNVETRQAKQLVTQADAKNRHLAEQIPDRVDGVGDGSRIARPV